PRLHEQPHIPLIELRGASAELPRLFISHDRLSPRASVRLPLTDQRPATRSPDPPAPQQIRLAAFPALTPRTPFANRPRAPPTSTRPSTAAARRSGAAGSRRAGTGWG